MRWQMIMHGRRRDRGLANRHRNLIQATDDVARGVQAPPQDSCKNMPQLHHVPIRTRDYKRSPMLLRAYVSDFIE
jgi:hypothetical protein